MKTYTRHNCSRTHRTFMAMARCIWRRAEWVLGTEGPYASLAYCRVLTVELHATLESAERAQAIINNTGCGGFCNRRHELVFLAK